MADFVSVISVALAVIRQGACLFVPSIVLRIDESGTLVLLQNIPWSGAFCGSVHRVHVALRA